MDKIIRVTTLLGGCFIIAVALTHITLGQSWIPDTTEVTPSLDSEHRFYASLFLMYGIALLWVARDLSSRRPVLHFLLLSLFVGGLARIPSVVVHGWPHAMFVVLGVLELVLPPALWAMSRTATSALSASYESATT